MDSPESAADLGNMRGHAVQEFASWYEAEFGAARLLEAFERLPPGDRVYFDRTKPGLGVSAKRWHPLATIHRMLDALTYGMSLAEVERVGRVGGEATARGMMRGAQSIIFALFMTPERYGAFVDKLWRLTYDHGGCRHRVVGPHSDETVIVDWRGHHPLLCLITCSVKATLYRAIGCQNVVLDHRCISRGDPECAANVTWTE